MTAQEAGGVIEPGEARFSRGPRGALTLRIGGVDHGHVTPVRAYPVTAPGRYIAVLDQEGQELGLIMDLQELDADSRRALEEELGLLYFMPVITAVHGLRRCYSGLEWRIRTDRGDRVIETLPSGCVRVLGDGRFLLTDIHAMNYISLEPDELDESSRNFLDAGL